MVYGKYSAFKNVSFIAQKSEILYLIKIPEGFF
jgi:hypothetical protein